MWLLCCHSFGRHSLVVDLGAEEMHLFNLITFVVLLIAIQVFVIWFDVWIIVGIPAQQWKVVIIIVDCLYFGHQQCFGLSHCHIYSVNYVDLTSIVSQQVIHIICLQWSNSRQLLPNMWQIALTFFLLNQTFVGTRTCVSNLHLGIPWMKNPISDFKFEILYMLWYCLLSIINSIFLQ